MPHPEGKGEENVYWASSEGHTLSRHFMNNLLCKTQPSPWDRSHLRSAEEKQTQRYQPALMLPQSGEAQIWTLPAGVQNLYTSHNGPVPLGPVPLFHIFCIKKSYTLIKAQMSPLLRRISGILLRGLLHAIDLFSEPLFPDTLGTYVLPHSKSPMENISRQNYNQKRYTHPYIHSSTVHNSQDVEKPKCPSTDEWIKEMWYICTMEYYSAIKRMK